MSNNSQDFKSRVAIVTGASGNIGGAIALNLAEAGFKVALHFNNSLPEKTLATICDNAGDSKAFKADLKAPGFEVDLLDQIKNDLGTPTVLINCAASQDVAQLAHMSQTQFDQMMETNVSAVFALCREFAIRLTALEAKHASIVNISSIEGSRPANGHGHYATSKAALEMLTKSFALEFGTTGLRTNAIAPGLITRKGIEQDWPEGVARWNKTCPMERLGRPEDVASVVRFLVSDEAAFVNGTVINVDGGMGATSGW